MLNSEKWYFCSLKPLTLLLFPQTWSTRICCFCKFYNLVENIPLQIYPIFFKHFQYLAGLRIINLEDELE